ncbi:hypothetical protein DFP72DRAFT_1130705 [Ephemerocybe angulata]|uniref:Small nuclear ribonucleoprotein Prp3 C-terminal domain-containing protein n=1 Tax=Ephemerocybe angulata TaxID=980116 RepID=A0A8H6HUP9_9AGAR|nr:hypothetical protein DFP72DRAFT_1130705 [Tulosesus angulatus]
MSTPQIRLEELQLIQCSLMPGETMTFVEDADFWNDALGQSTERDIADFLPKDEASTALFTLKLDNKPIWFQVAVYMQSDGHLISVKGNNMSRGEQERWLDIIREKERETEGVGFPLYHLLSQLVPMLHDAPLDRHTEDVKEQHEPTQAENEPTFHVLFTSHHLISSKKRRSLQQWTSQLKLSGFAKIGYPGVIYAQGRQKNLEEFVSNVKGMQWLALRVRFVEAVPKDSSGEHSSQGTLLGWQEFSRVGEVVEEMRRIGREEFVLEMGIGSSGSA